MECMQKGIEIQIQIIFHYKPLYLEEVFALLLFIKFNMKNLISKKVWNFHMEMSVYGLT